MRLLSTTRLMRCCERHVRTKSVGFEGVCVYTSPRHERQFGRLCADYAVMFQSVLQRGTRIPCLVDNDQFFRQFFPMRGVPGWMVVLYHDPVAIERQFGVLFERLRRRVVAGNYFARVDAVVAAAIAQAQEELRQFCMPEVCD